MTSGAIRKARGERTSYPSFLSADSVAGSEELDLSFAAVSPRTAMPRTPIHAFIIYGCVLAFWLVLTVMALVSQNFSAWSVGVVYIVYDTLLIAFVATQIASLLRPRHRDKTTHGPNPSIAVVVAAWNEAAALPATIDALLAQSDRPELILVADDGSDDATPAVLRERYGLDAPIAGGLGEPGDAPSLRWLRLPHRGKAHALNAALSQVATDLVVTVDADTILRDDAIAVMRAAFAADDKLVVGGGVLTPVCDPTPTGRCLEFFQHYEYIRNFMSRFAWARVDALLLVSGAFAAFRREPLTAVGGFDTSSLVEDYELIHRLQRVSREQHLGWRVTVLGRARANTGAPGRLDVFLRQRRRWFAGFLQTQYWNRDMTGTRRFGTLGLAMMPVKAIDTLQPLYGLTATALLPVFLVSGRADLVIPAFGLMSAKIVIDLAFYVACIALYKRWTGDDETIGGLRALAAAAIEPFTFQPLRHLGAALGWVALLSGDRGWGRARKAPSD